MTPAQSMMLAALMVISPHISEQFSRCLAWVFMVAGLLFWMTE